MTEFLLFYIALIVTAIAVKSFFCSNDSGKTPDDPTGEIKLQIFDTLKKIQDDLEKTV